MREEVRNLWIQAQEDLKTAEVLIKEERFYASVFFSHQAAEKSLKALYLDKKKEMKATHNLLLLARELEGDEEIIKACRELTPDYLTTRYPNSANGIPAEMYDKEIAEEHLESAKKVIKWVSEKSGKMISL